MEMCHKDVQFNHRQGVNDINETYIGHKLKSLRIEHDLKQCELADALAVSTSTISHWEKGRRIPSLIEIGRIADYFGIAMRTLIEPPETAMGETHKHHLGKGSDHAPFIRRISSGQVTVMSFATLLLVLGNCAGEILGMVLFVFGVTGITYLFLPVLVQGMGLFFKGSDQSFDRQSGNLAIHVAKKGIDTSKVRSRVLLLSTIGGIFLILATLFHVIALLVEKDRIIAPLVMSLAGFILLWVRVKVPAALEAIHPFVGRVSSEDRRLAKGQMLLLGAILMDSLSAIAFFITSESHQAFMRAAPFALVALLSLSIALLTDLVNLCLNQRFLDGFHVHDGDKGKGDVD